MWPSVHFKPSRFVALGAGVVWLLLVAGGMARLSRYESTPSVTASPLETWPGESALRRDSKRPTLIMFAHPQCPCTRASLEELARLTTRCPDQASVSVVFVQPAGFSDAWVKGRLWRQAAAIPGVSVFKDPEGREARRFHAITSGYLVLYDAEGRLRFHGGITESRGHSGDNEGRSDLTEILTGQAVAHPQTPVYGCSLFSEQVSAQVLFSKDRKTN